MQNSVIDMSVHPPSIYNTDFYSPVVIQEPPSYCRYVVNEPDDLETIILEVPSTNVAQVSSPDTNLDSDTRRDMIKYILETIRARIPQLSENIQKQSDDIILILYSIAIWCESDSGIEYRLASIPILTPLLAKYIPQKTCMTWRVFLFKLLLPLLLVIFIDTIGINIFIHEYFGHLLLGGALLTEPQSRFSISYPSIYYQVDSFDRFIELQKNTTLKNFGKWINPLNIDFDGDGFNGRAFSLRGATNYTRLYDLWGKDQASAWLSLSGTIPGIIINLLIGKYILSNRFEKGLTGCISAMSFLMGMHCYSIIGSLVTAWNCDNINVNVVTDNDFENWAIRQNKITGMASANIAVLTAVYLLFLVPFVIYIHYLYYSAKPRFILDKISTYKFTLRESNKPLLLPYFRDVFQNYKTDYWQDLLRNSLLPTCRPNNPILEKTNINLDGLHRHLYKHFQKKGFKEIIDLHFLRADFPIHEKIPFVIRKIQGLMWVIGFSGPIIHAACYASGYSIDHPSRNLIYLPLASIIILIVEFTWSSIYQVKHLNRSELIYCVFEAIGYVSCFVLLTTFINKYDPSELSNMWGGYYLPSILISLLISLHSRYQKTLSLVERTHSKYLC
jgi:hypothetical protein